MTTVDSTVLVEDDMADIGKHWGLILALGIVSVIAGVVAMVWPGATILVLAILVGAWLLVSGIFQVVRGFARGLSGGTRAMLIIFGGLSIIIGLFALSGVWRAVEILYLFIAIGFLFQGIGLLFAAGDRSGSRGWDIFGGIVMLVGGVVILAWPVRSLVVLAWVAGIWLVIGGIVEIIAAFRLRSLAKA
jgi:uncharacterized membrane protein HdeD (DUF308 family)